MSQIGHNRGPTIEPGQSWRKHCWTKARRDLLSTLPIEILRGRVKRAREIGLDYTTYASVRASTGRDVIGFLFSSNALRAYKSSPVLPGERLEKLNSIENCARIALVSKPLTPAEMAAANASSPMVWMTAPGHHDIWRDSRQNILSVLGAENLPADGVLLIGDTALEREWSLAGRLAGYLPAERYFRHPS
ncbi:MAG: hypothetical protein V3U96_09350 [Paracoccaceae bacterium]